MSDNNLRADPQATLGRTVPFSVQRVDSPVQLTPADLALEVTIEDGVITSMMRLSPDTVLPNGVFIFYPAVRREFPTAQQSSPDPVSAALKTRLLKLQADLGERRDWDGLNEVEDKLE